MAPATWRPQVHLGLKVMGPLVPCWHVKLCTHRKTTRLAAGACYLAVAWNSAAWKSVMAWNSAAWKSVMAWQLKAISAVSGLVWGLKPTCLPFTKGDNHSGTRDPYPLALALVVLHGCNAARLPINRHRRCVPVTCTSDCVEIEALEDNKDLQGRWGPSCMRSVHALLPRHVLSLTQQQMYGCGCQPGDGHARCRARTRQGSRDSALT